LTALFPTPPFPVTIHSRLSLSLAIGTGILVLDSAAGGDQHVHFRRDPMLKNNPVMKRLVETGEERIGKIAQQLLSNETFVAAVQSLVSRSLAAKGTLDKSLRATLSAMNVPSTADLENLRGKVDDLERTLSSVEAKMDSLLSQKKE
ncbi:MAG TPA: hypothetical protein VF947_00320, partial [Myxococcales bacterium]